MARGVWIHIDSHLKELQLLWYVNVFSPLRIDHMDSLLREINKQQSLRSISRKENAGQALLNWALDAKLREDSKIKMDMELKVTALHILMMETLWRHTVEPALILVQYAWCLKVAEHRQSHNNVPITLVIWTAFVLRWTDC